MHHLDVAGGTGDVAFRVLRAVRATEAEARAKAATAPPQLFTPTPPKAAAGDASGPSLSGSTAPVRHAADSAPPGSVVVCDINPAMLDAGRRKADASSDLASRLLALDHAMRMVRCARAVAVHCCIRALLLPWCCADGIFHVVSWYVGHAPRSTRYPALQDTQLGPDPSACSVACMPAIILWVHAHMLLTHMYCLCGMQMMLVYPSWRATQRSWINLLTAALTHTPLPLASAM